jgi:hypothetical protein
MYLKRFKTQKLAKEYVRELYARTPLGIIHNQEFDDVLKHHPAYEAKVGCGILHLEMTIDFFQNKVVYIHRTDGTSEPFSWTVCITRPSAEASYLYDLNSALREAVTDQILEFRSTHELKCPCGYIGDKFHVDHVVLFKDLTSAFLKDRDPPKMFGKCPQSLRKTIDGEFKEAWSKYHKKNAILRILCQKCNLTRTKQSS